jgi:hypothetical protein
MRRLVVLTVASLAALVAVSAAPAKEAMVTLASKPPRDMSAGTPWSTNITVMEDGDRPSASAPAVMLLNLRTGAQIELGTTPTGEPGVYHAVVRFPAAGDWRYSVRDTASDRIYEFPPLVVGPAPSGGDGLPAWPLVGAAIFVAVALSGAALLVLRRQRVVPATG